MSIIELLDKPDLGINNCLPTEESINFIKEHLRRLEDEDMAFEYIKRCILSNDACRLISALITGLILGDAIFADKLFKIFRSEIRDRIKNELIPYIMKDSFFLEECARIVNKFDASADETADVSTAGENENIGDAPKSKNIINKNGQAQGWFYIVSYSDKGVRRHIRLVKESSNPKGTYTIVIDSAEAVDRWATPFFNSSSSAVEFVNKMDNMTVKTKRDIESYVYHIRRLEDGKMGPIKNSTTFKSVHTAAGDCFISEFADVYAESFDDHNLFEASGLTTLEKMRLFDTGTRKENLKACKDSKLWDFRDTCIRNDLNNALYQVESEMISRGLLAVRTSPIIAHNVSRNTQNAVTNSVSNNPIIDPNAFALSTDDIYPANTSFIIDHLDDSNWDEWFQKNVIDSMKNTNIELEFILPCMLIYVITLIVKADTEDATSLISVIKYKTNWSDADVAQCLQRIMQNPQLMGKFEECINFSLKTQTEALNVPLTEKIEKHDTLNPKLWNEDGTLKKEVHDKIIAIADEFIDWLKEDGIKFDLKDIRIVGSNCSYNYTEDSDLDVHLIADSSTLDCPDDLYPLLYSSYRSLFNKNLNIDFYGIPVEIYVEVE